MNELFRIENLRKEYQNRGFSKKTTAIDGISAVILQDETTAVVGESGSGKSTLGMILAGLDVQSSGTLCYKGRDTKSLILSGDYRRQVQIIFQNPFDSLDPRWTVQQSMKEPIRHHRVVKREQERMYITKLLFSCGLGEEVLEKKPRQLSGGQLQRIAIARILALKPDVLIADEIVTALDAAVQSKVLDLLKDIRKQYPFSLIFISHDLAVVRRIADRIIVMKEGKILEEGKKEDIFSNPRSEYTKALIKAIPKFRIGV